MREDVRGVGNPLNVPKDPSADLGNFSSLFGTSQRIKQDRGGLHTSVYRKPTNLGLCLSGDSECPSKYKTSVISSFVRRALSHSSTWNNVHQELEHITQQLVDDGYTNKDIQRVTRMTLDR